MRRLIVESSLGVGDSRGQLGLLGTWIAVPIFLARIYADKERQESIITGSQLDWTIVRPAMLTNGPLTKLSNMEREGSNPAGIPYLTSRRGPPHALNPD